MDEANMQTREPSEEELKEFLASFKDANRIMGELRSSGLSDERVTAALPLVLAASSAHLDDAGFDELLLFFKEHAVWARNGIRQGLLPVNLKK